MSDSLDDSADKLTKSLADVLERKRQQLSLSQEEIARRAGLSRTYLSDIERGLRNISVATLAKISRAMGTEAWLLLAEAEKSSLQLATVHNVAEGQNHS